MTVNFSYNIGTNGWITGSHVSSRGCINFTFGSSLPPSTLGVFGSGFFDQGFFSQSDDYFARNFGYMSDYVSKSMSANHLIRLDQIHSDRVKLVSQADRADSWWRFSAPLEMREASFQADALVSVSKGLCLSVATADCMPLICYDLQTGVIAVIHAGWQGLHKGLISRTLEAMCEQGACRENIFVIIGPHISQFNYQVERGFVDRWLNSLPHSASFFSADKGDYCVTPQQLAVTGESTSKDGLLKLLSSGTGDTRFHFSLFAAALYEIQKFGCCKVVPLCFCTYSDIRYFSHRRYSHVNEGCFGDSKTSSSVSSVGAASNGRQLSMVSMV